MATDEERLVVLLEARIRDFETNMKKASRTSGDTWRKIEKDASSSATKLERVMAGAGQRIGAGFAGGIGAIVAGLGVREVVQFADAWTRANNSLKVAGLSGDDLKSTMGQLFDAAQRQGAPLEALVTLYGRASQSATELGASNADLIRFSEDVAIALRVAGTSSGEASGALLQLAQLLGSSRVAAEEFNSVSEAARPILQAVANGMEEAGGSVSKLKALVTDGKVSNVAFFRAFQAGAAGLREQAGAADSTLSQAFERVSNAITRAIGELDKTAGASQNAVRNLGHVSDAIGKIPAAVNMAADKLAELQKWLNQAGDSAFWTKFGKLMGVQFSPEESAKNGITYTPQGDPRKAGMVMLKSGMGTPLSQDTGMLRSNPVANPVKASDYPVVGSKEKGGRERIDQFDRAVESLRRHSEAMQTDISVMGKSTFEVERARAAQELLSAAKAQYGDSISPDVRAKIDREATAYAHVAAAAEEAQRAHREWLGMQQEIGGFLSGNIASLVSGYSSFNDVLQNGIGLLTQMALKAALLGEGPLASLFGMGMGATSAGPGGLIGMLFTGLPKFADGGIARGPSIFGEAGPEAAVPLPDGRRIPVDLRLPAPAAATAQAPTTITVAPTINVQGGTGSREDNQDLAQRISKEVEAVASAVFMKELARQKRPGGALNHVRNY